MYTQGSQTALIKLGFKPEAVERILQLAKKRITRRTFPGVLSGPEAGPHTLHARMVRGLQKLPGAEEVGRRLEAHVGKIYVPPRDFAHFLRKFEIGGVPKNVTPAERKLLDSMAKAHELDEIALSRRNSSRDFFMHASPDVILREHNRLVTMPKGSQRIQDVFKKMRAPTVEDPLTESSLLKRVGLTFGEGPRLSRHARKRISQRIKEISKDIEA